MSVESRPDFCVNADLLALLCCPETRQRLRVATMDELLRAKVADGIAREDGLVIYPILDGIPMLMVEHAVRIGE